MNQPNDSHCKDSILSLLKPGVGNTDNICFVVNEVKDAVDPMKNGKSQGLDNLQSEHFKFSHPIVVDILCTLFNCMMSHGFVPSKLMETIIVPIVKDKKGIVTSKDNYRPIAITSVASKILEYLLLERMKSQLDTADNQFGFKAKHGTDMCVFALKQVIEYYQKNGSPVYICFLDASKAFDRVDHWALLNKLYKRNVNLQIIRLLLFWYSNQRFCVRWGRIYSTSFLVSNGVRQGGIMSPILFNVYMDDLSNILNKSGLGCHLGGVSVNNLLYADDTCILAPSPSALQRLLKLCELFACDNNVIFNAAKTKYMCLKTKTLKDLIVPDVLLSGNALTRVSVQKYLGVLISDDCQDDVDIKRHVRSLYSRGNSLVKRFRHCSVDVKNFLFKSFCSNIYGGQLWCNFKNESIKKALVAFNDIYRYLLHIKRGESMSMLNVMNHLDSFNVLLRKNCFSFKSRILSSDNNIISIITSSHYFNNHSSLRRKWNELLFL